MFKKVDRKASRQKKQMSIRNKISGTPERPRLSVFRSNTNIFAQLIDDVNGVTLVSASTIDKALRGSIANGGNVEAAKGKGLEISLGYSHPVIIDEIPGITFTVEKNTTIHIDGIEKELVGQVAANIRAKRPPEPYKGKGVKYADEHIRRKEGKKS